MSLPHKSIATIDNIEFVNLTPLDINPLMSKCQIKVFYIGKNRNGSYIKKQVATEMAKTLRGAPIVGYYKDSKEDFADHGEKVTLDDEGIHFECMTKPYGFVSPDAKVWFKKFMEEDDFGNQIQRQYLMTTGYLWTEQYPETKSIFDDGGKPQSMQIDGNTLKGRWAEDNNSGMEFFIINDAIISKLCILGNDVEPCFEGSSITDVEVSKTFTKLDDNFKNTLFSMMEDLKLALQGGNTVNELENKTSVEETFSLENEDNVVEQFSEENQENIEEVSNSSDFAKKDDEEEEKSDSESEEDKDEEEQEEDKDKKFAEDKQTNANASTRIEKHPFPAGEAGGSEREPEEETATPAAPSTNAALETDEYTSLKKEFDELQEKYSLLEAENQELVEFKNQVEDQQKDELIQKFYMLSDEDKKDIVENKRNYTLEQIEEKLAVICFRKKVSFDLDSTTKNQKEQTEETTVTTFNINNNMNDSTSDWIKAVEEVQKTL